MRPLPWEVWPRVAPATFVLLLLTPAPLLGYIDPISGSIILQILAAGFLATVLSMKRVWARTSSFVKKVLSRVRRDG